MFRGRDQDSIETDLVLVISSTQHCVDFGEIRSLDRKAGVSGGHCVDQRAGLSDRQCIAGMNPTRQHRIDDIIVPGAGAMI